MSALQSISVNAQTIKQNRGPKRSRVGKSPLKSRRSKVQKIAQKGSQKENMLVAPLDFGITACKKASTSRFDSLKGLCIEVEGNIGSGKSTLTQNMVKFLKNETVDDKFAAVFCEKVNNTFLGAFYSDLKRFAFAFQMYMLTTRLYQMDESTRQAKEENRCVFLDRGAVGDTLFALLSQKMGNIDDQEMKVYKSVCRERMPKSIADSVAMFVYLDVEPKECHRRMTTLRGRKEEDSIPLAYLDSVDEVYFHLMMDWMGCRKATYHEMNIGPPPPVIVKRWTKFGQTEDVIKLMQDLQAGKRRSPTVSFQVKKDVPFQSTDALLVLHTEADIKESYALLQSTDCPVEDSSKITPAVTLSVNWDLPHTNSFRRIVMYFLSTCSSIVFYGESTVVAPSTDALQSMVSPVEADAKATDDAPLKDVTNSV